MPRFRQKLAVPPFQAGRPLWVDDPTFNLSYHIRHTALPRRATRSSCAASPGGSSRSSSTARSRSGSCWLVQGLERNRFALISKTHHAMVDGVSGVDISTVLFDVKPVPEPAPPERRVGARPRALDGAAAGEGRRRTSPAPR